MSSAVEFRVEGIRVGVEYDYTPRVPESAEEPPQEDCLTLNAVHVQAGDIYPLLDRLEGIPALTLLTMRALLQEHRTKEYFDD